MTKAVSMPLSVSSAITLSASTDMTARRSLAYGTPYGAHQQQLISQHNFCKDWRFIKPLPATLHVSWCKAICMA